MDTRCKQHTIAYHTIVRPCRHAGQSGVNVRRKKNIYKKKTPDSGVTAGSYNSSSLKL